MVVKSRRHYPGSLALRAALGGREADWTARGARLKPCAKQAEVADCTRLFCARRGAGWLAWFRHARPEDSGLIVTCSECTTSFQLDEARIPTTGAQVRCSRCKHAFFLAHPSASQSESVHEIAGAAAADPTAGIPDPSSDLGGLPVSGLDGGGVADQSDEEEWQFSEEVRVEGDEDRAAEPAPAAPQAIVEEPGFEEDSDFGLNEDFGEGLDADAIAADLNASDVEVPEPETPAVAEMAAGDDGGGSGLELDGPEEPVVSSDGDRDESSFGSVDDFSSLMEDEEEPALSTESAPSVAAPATPSPGSYSETGKTDDLGDPESWDLIGAAPASAKPSSKQSAGTADSSSTGAALDGALAELEFAPDEDSVTYDEEQEPSALGALVAKFGHGVGWAVTTIALIAVGGLLIGPEFSRWADAPQYSTAGALRARTTEMNWVETARSGFVLVMRGEVENAGTEDLLPSNVRLWLLDGSGERLTAASVSVGFPLNEEALREASESTLRAQRKASVNAFVSRPIAPGESRVFEAIVLEETLPERARRILLQIDGSNDVTSSLPGAVNPRRLAGSGTENQAEAAGSAGSADPQANVPGTQGARPKISDLLDLDD